MHKNMGEESCGYRQDSFFTKNLLTPAAKQKITRQHTGAYHQKSHKITRYNPHQKHSKPDTKQRIPNHFFHFAKTPQKKMHISYYMHLCSDHDTGDTSDFILSPIPTEYSPSPLWPFPWLPRLLPCPFCW